MAQEIAQTSVQPENQSETLAPAQFAVRVGLHGQIGRFRSNVVELRRHCQVVCRTARGIERGLVLGRLREAEFSGRQCIPTGR